MLSDARGLPAWMNRPVRPSERAVVMTALVAGLILRLVQIATSIGSIDAYFWTRHVQIVESVGVLRSYFAAEVINHPPLALALAQLTRRAGAVAGLQFFDAFRLLQAVADIVAAFTLLRLARHLPGISAPFVAMAYFLSPGAIFVSAFHCNSDPLMVMLLLLALLAAVERRPLLAGIAIGAACGIKIIAFVAWPLLLLACRGAAGRLRYAIGSAVTLAGIFVPALVVSGAVMIRNVFLYTGWRGGWGLPLLARIAELSATGTFRDTAAPYVTGLLIAGLVAVWSAEAWRTRAHGPPDARRLLRVTGATFLFVLVAAPGFLPHYVLWFLPFPAVLFGRRAAIALHALASVFLFAMYTSWSGGWPWVYGNRMSSMEVGTFGLFVWLVLAVALAAALRSLYRRAAAAPPAAGQP